MEIITTQDLIDKVNQITDDYASSGLNGELWWHLDRPAALGVYNQGKMGLPWTLALAPPVMPEGLGRAEVVNCAPNFTHSLDAAYKLKTKLFGSHELMMSEDLENGIYYVKLGMDNWDESFYDITTESRIHPAIAIVLAILRLTEHQEDKIPL